METATGIGVYLAAGVVITALAKWERWITKARWWHVVFWPAVFGGWALLLGALWVLSGRPLRCLSR